METYKSFIKNSEKTFLKRNANELRLELNRRARNLNKLLTEIENAESYLKDDVDEWDFTTARLDDIYLQLQSLYNDYEIENPKI